jgi:hypothetical protein
MPLAGMRGRLTRRNKRLAGCMVNAVNVPYMATATAKRGKGKGTKATPPPAKKKPKKSKPGQAKDPVSQATFLQTVKVENPGITSDQLAEKFNMPVEEVARMRGFLVEYMKDFNEENAALRMGYPDLSARATGKLLLYHSFTQLRLQELLDRAEVDALVTPSRIVAGLVKEANAPDVAFSSNAGTRISAWKELAKILGMLNPKPKEDDRKIRRIMYVPVAADWEAGARHSQKLLKASTVIDI